MNLKDILSLCHDTQLVHLIKDEGKHGWQFDEGTALEVLKMAIDNANEEISWLETTNSVYVTLTPDVEVTHIETNNEALEIWLKI